MRAVDPKLTVVDYGCPAETTISFTTACDFQESGVQLHDGYPGRSQESAALDFLRAHRGQVSPITVSLGGNDFFAGSSLADIQTRLTRILGELRAAAPDAEIIVLQTYNPLTFFAQDPVPDAAISALNGVIGAAAASAGARTADSFAVFNNPNPAPPATELTNICMWTLICSDGVNGPDGHATDLGYQKIADIFWEASGYGRLTPDD
jgi:lysophospholipase L1-like esterase